MSPELCRRIKSFWLLRVFLIDGHGLGMFLLLGYLPQEVSPTGPLPTIYCKTLADILECQFLYLTLDGRVALSKCLAVNLNIIPSSPPPNKKTLPAP